MTKEDFELLSRIESLLGYGLEGDECYCDDDKCSMENPQCRPMHNQKALQKIQELVEPPHRSLQPRRLVNDPERIYAEQWQLKNVRKSYVNSGYTCVEWILCPDGQKTPDRVKRRDAAVAASVIQWLGTNCGNAFIVQTERKIERARAVRRSWGNFVNLNQEPPAADLQIAELLAGPMKNHPAHHDLVRGIVAALINAREEVITTVSSLDGGKQI